MSKNIEYTILDVLKKIGKIKTIEDALLWIDSKLKASIVCVGNDNEITNNYLRRLETDHSMFPIKPSIVNDEMRFVCFINDCCLRMNKTIEELRVNTQLLNQESYETKQWFDNIKEEKNNINNNFKNIDINLDNTFKKLKILENENVCLIQNFNYIEKKNSDNFDFIIKRLEFLENETDRLNIKNTYLEKKIEQLEKKFPVDIINTSNNPFDHELTNEFIVF